MSDDRTHGNCDDGEVAIGLEVQAQIGSKSKLFGDPATAFGPEPNMQVSLFDPALAERELTRPWTICGYRFYRLWRKPKENIATPLRWLDEAVELCRALMIERGRVA